MAYSLPNISPGFHHTHIDTTFLGRILSHGFLTRPPEFCGCLGYFVAANFVLDADVGLNDGR